MKTRKINSTDAFGQVKEFWRPVVAGKVNNHQVKLAKFKDDFIWHKHEHEDEFFYVVKGSIILAFRDHEQQINEGEFIVVPRGVEHKPSAKDEAWVMLFEPAETLNTGDKADSEKTIRDLKRLDQ